MKESKSLKNGLPRLLPAAELEEGSIKAVEKTKILMRLLCPIPGQTHQTLHFLINTGLQTGDLDATRPRNRFSGLSLFLRMAQGPRE